MYFNSIIISKFSPPHLPPQLLLDGHFTWRPWPALYRDSSGWETIFSANGAGTNRSSHEKQDPQSWPHFKCKNQSGIDQRPKYQIWWKAIFRKIKGKKCFDLWLDQDVLERTQKWWTIRQKIDKLDFVKIINLSPSWNYQRMRS